MDTITDNTSLSPKARTRPVVENDAYQAFACRVVRAYGRRAARDPEAVAGMLALYEETARQMHGAVQGLRDRGWSDGEVGRVLGVSRQAVRQRWPRKV